MASNNSEVPAVTRQDDWHTAFSYRVLMNTLIRLRSTDVLQHAATASDPNAATDDTTSHARDGYAVAYAIESEWRRRLAPQLRPAAVLQAVSGSQADATFDVDRAKVEHGAETRLKREEPSATTVGDAGGAAASVPVVHPLDAPLATQQTQREPAPLSRGNLSAVKFPWRELVDSSPAARAFLLNCRRSRQLHALKPGDPVPPRAEDDPQLMAEMDAEARRSIANGSAVPVTVSKRARRLSQPPDESRTCVPERSPSPPQRLPHRTERTDETHVWVEAAASDDGAGTGAVVISIADGDVDAGTIAEADRTASFPAAPAEDAHARMAVVYAAVRTGVGEVSRAVRQPDAVPLTAVGPGIVRLPDGTEFPFAKAKLRP